MVSALFKIAYIEKVDGLYYVFSHKGKRLSRGYKTKEEALKRLRQIEFFKHKNQKGE